MLCKSLALFCCNWRLDRTTQIGIMFSSLTFPLTNSPPVSFSLFIWIFMVPFAKLWKILLQLFPYVCMFYCTHGFTRGQALALVIIFFDMPIKKYFWKSSLWCFCLAYGRFGVSCYTFYCSEVFFKRHVP